MALTTTQRGYGSKHVAERKRWAAMLKVAGALPCTEPKRGCPGMVLDGSRWDLAHDHVNGGYKGVAHATCNRTEGARRGGIKVAARRRLLRTLVANPSRRW